MKREKTIFTFLASFGQNVLGLPAFLILLPNDWLNPVGPMLPDQEKKADLKNINFGAGSSSQSYGSMETLRFPLCNSIRG